MLAGYVERKENAVSKDFQIIRELKNLASKAIWIAVFTHCYRFCDWSKNLPYVFNPANWSYASFSDFPKPTIHTLVLVLRNWRESAGWCVSQQTL